MINIILNYLLFFLGTVLLALAVSWIDRKVTARVQWRVGPPLLQPVYDLIKLLNKETVIPQNAAMLTFVSAPLVSFASISIISIIIWNVIINPSQTFLGDWVVIVYLLTIPAIAVIIGASSSANPLASLGASREMKLVLAYELPFVLACLVPVIKAGGTLKLGDIVYQQMVQGHFVLSLSGMIAFVVAVVCMQAKLGLVPFDMAEAETEIMAGAYIEYSGAMLALFKLTRQMLVVVVPLLLVIMFLGGMVFSGWSILWSILKYVLLVVIIVLIRNTNPRVRIDQAVKFFWSKMTLAAVLAVVLAVVGL